jgi:HAD superfamily hydrolase (TIGR01509 family)
VTRAALLDVDGTLVDTNYHHAIAWYRAMRQNGVVVPVWRIHRHIGMGGDQLVAAVAGEGVESESGDAIRDAEKALYMAMIEEVEPLEGARELISDVRDRVDRVVLASSAKEDEVEHYVELLDARELADGWTTSADVDATKPHPDLVESAMAKAEADEALLIGDTPWDVKAAERAGVRTAAVLTGGFSAAELRDAGAIAVFESIPELRAALDELPVVSA